MSTYKNPVNAQIAANNDSAGEITVNPQVFDMTNAAYKPTSALAVGDLIEVGVVPTGCVLVPHLSRIQIGVIANTAGAVEVGITGNTACLAAAGSATAARDLVGAGLSASIVIGSRTQPTPIYARVTTAFTANGTGVIRADLAVRAFEAAIDG